MTNLCFLSIASRLLVELFVSSFVQGKRVSASKKCNHNINQPLQSSRNN